MTTTAPTPAQKPQSAETPHAKGFFHVANQVRKRLKRHNMMVNAAGIAFYGLLSLVPTLIALVSIYGLVSDPDDITTQLKDTAGSLDDSTRGFVENQLLDITQSEGNIVALLVGIALALFSASGAVQKLMTTIQLSYETVDTRSGLVVRAVAYGLTLGAIVGVVLIVLLLGVIPRILDQVDLGTGVEATIGIARLPVLAVLFSGGLTVLYRYSSDQQPRTPWRNPGAVVATGVWVLFAIGFNFYSANVGAMPASYGLLGSVAALMIFLQLTALAVIIGAEVNAVVEQRSAAATTSKQLPSRPAETALKGAASSDSEPAAPISFGKALAGLAALFVLGRGGKAG